MASCTGIHHAALSVRDLDASAGWYERLFDLERVMDEAGDGRRGRVYRVGGAMFGLVQHAATDGSAFSPDRTGLDHLAFSAPTRNEIDAWSSHLDHLGVEHSGVIEIPHGAILNFADPDGIQLSIFWER